MAIVNSNTHMENGIFLEETVYLRYNGGNGHGDGGGGGVFSEKTEESSSLCF